jgi:hypothetical protein
MLDQKKMQITKDTLIPLSMVVTLCGGVIWISTQLNHINYKLDILETKLQDQWTKRDMENWGLKLKLDNPDIIIPEVKQ